MTDRMTVGPQFGTLVSLPTAGILLVLFFLPWLELRCDMKEAAKMAGNVPAEMKEMKLEGKGFTLAHASGWQLTTGDIIPEQGPEEGKDQLSKVVGARPWFALGLAIPVILLIGSFGIVQGKLDFKPWGKGMVALGVVGLLICVLGINVDYADDLIAYNEQKQGNLSCPPNAGGAYGQFQMDDQIASFFRTCATPILFSSVILYVIVIGCGFLLVRKPIADTGESAELGPVAPSAGLGLQAPMMAASPQVASAEFGLETPMMEPPPQAPARPSSPPPDFGPSIYTPPKE